MRKVLGQWLVLTATVLGVPLVACGGRVILESEQDAGHDSSPIETATNAPTGTGSTSATSTATATTTNTGSSSGSFGPFPCTAYTSWNYSCPPTAGTAGCKYAVAVNGDPNDGWMDSPTQSQAVGCQLEIVAPTDVGGSTCQEMALCRCEAPGMWVAERSGDYCPNN
jgi:hypothetical protein